MLNKNLTEFIPLKIMTCRFSFSAITIIFCLVAGYPLSSNAEAANSEKANHQITTDNPSDYSPVKIETVTEVIKLTKNYQIVLHDDAVLFYPLVLDWKKYSYQNGN
jgi:hypothetical protein